jgi:ATP-dependent DNA helicase RecG
LQDQVAAGDQLVLYGKTAIRKGGLVFQHPDFERVGSDDEESLHVGRIVPVYPLTENLPQRVMRRIVHNALESGADQARETLPEEMIRRRSLPGLEQALWAVHFPERFPEAERARYRLAFEEFLCVQLILVARKIQAERFLEGRAHDAPGRLKDRFLASLSFSLTGAQRRVLQDIAADMKKKHPMHRLLQGDVGSGKTVVAACAVLDAIECGSQAVLMAPTEILAAQHFQTMNRFLAPLEIRTTLLVSDLSARDRRDTLAGIKSGRFQLVVGTHAIIQEGVVFDRLGLAVIDEQHKFGVEQRGLLYGKGRHPDVLVMTATPIPRTLAMTLYGDLDVSVIDELPSGRREIVTRVIRADKLPEAYGFIKKQVGKGRQAYLVYPLVAESDAMELKAAEEMYRHLKDTVFQGLRIGLLHGQMKSAEKNAAMRRFERGEVDVLVSTTVIEVGIDVPNANVMLVENAERFGLSQLHQLRGRIGRGAHKSFCILQGEPGTEDSWKRLKVMEQTCDGFAIAEEDLKIRGMGNIMGREQSGFPAFRFGDPLRDGNILREARKEALAIVETDPRLEHPAYAGLKQRARALYREIGSFIKVG